MGTDLTTTTDQADGRRDQARRALNLHPSTTDRIVTILGDDAADCVSAAIEKAEHDLRPVPLDQRGRKGWETAIDERLRRLAAKVLPTAAPAQTQGWRDATIEALADLPAMVSLTAAKRAIHRPFRFIGDIEVTVREIAAEIVKDREGALGAMKRHRDEIERALAPQQPALPPVDPDREITDTEIRAMKPELRDLGLKAGFITQDQVDAALAEPALAA